MSPRVRSQIDMTIIRSFIRYIGVFSFTTLIITLLGFLLAAKSETNKVIYTMVIIINAFVTAGTFITLKLLKEK